MTFFPLLLVWVDTRFILSCWFLWPVLVCFSYILFYYFYIGQWMWFLELQIQFITLFGATNFTWRAATFSSICGFINRINVYIMGVFREHFFQDINFIFWANFVVPTDWYNLKGFISVFGDMYFNNFLFDWSQFCYYYSNILF